MIQRIFVATLVAFTCVSTFGEEPELRPGRLDRDARDALQPGLKVQFKSLDGDHAGLTDVRDARLAALYVQAGESPASFLPPGRFAASFSGYLKLRLRGEYTFQSLGRGGVTLRFNGEEVMSIPQGDLSTAAPVKVELVKGYNLIELAYESPPEGDAVMRLYWASDEFPAEPLPPTMLMHDGRDEAWQQGERLRAGRLALARRGCISCHSPSQALIESLADDGAQAMRELHREAPSLAGIGSRVDTSWLATWIADPSQVRNKTTMPVTLGHLDETAQKGAAADLAAFLSQQTSDEKFDTLAADGKIIRQGESLYEDRGCIACHRMTPVVDEDDDFDRVSLYFVDQKFKPGALSAFLQDTRHHYAWSRMPKFNLPKDEADALAAYLRHRSRGELPEVRVGDATRGRKLFAEVGCANCHSTKPQVDPAGEAPLRLADLNTEQGCLAEEVSGKVPRYSFDDGERDNLIAFLQTDRSSLERQVPAEFSRRQFDVIGCTACHRRDDTDADLPYVLLDESELGRQPESIPDLTWAGDKLRPEWMLAQFMGKLPYRPRPHFKAHMPAFPQRGELLSLGLSAEHGYAPKEDPRPEVDTNLAKTGEAVAAMHTGLACHRCHAIGDKQATAPFEARSTNLSYAAERLRYPYYHRWMRDPMRVDPSTKMIKFAQDGKKTGLTKFYDGDARQQFESVWHWLEVLNAEEKSKVGTAESEK